MSTVPRAAAKWMVSHLDSRRDQDWIVDHLETRGLAILNVKELKHLGGLLYSMNAVVEEASIWERRLPSSAKKQRRIDFLRRGLFRDDLCSIINDRLVQDMRSETRASSPNTTTARSTVPVSSSVETTAASNTGARKRPYSETLQQSQPRQQQQQNGFSAEDHAAAIFNAYMSQFNPPSSLAAQNRLAHNHGYNLWQDMPIPAAHESKNEEERRETGNGSGASIPSGSSSAGAGAAIDPQSNPQNHTEFVLLQQLLQMGFQKQEVLDGIRQCQSSTSATPSADEVMLHLVSQREEAEEARKEDEVRLLSEDQKQEEIRRREQNKEESLLKATTAEDLRAIFPDSWVLNFMVANPTDSEGNSRSVSTILDSNSRDDFLEFLKLEEKSRKWYGWVLPTGYFHKMGKRLKNVGGNDQIPSWETFLRNERKKLRCGLYELKEQLKGQPKIFLDERPQKNGGATEIVVIDDEDD